MRATGRSGGFDVVKSGNNVLQTATIHHVETASSTVPKFRTIISIQPDDHQALSARHSPPIALVSVSPPLPTSNGFEVIWFITTSAVVPLSTLNCELSENINV